LKGWLLFIQPIEQFKKLSKGSDWLEKSRTSKKTRILDMPTGYLATWPTA